MFEKLKREIAFSRSVKVVRIIIAAVALAIIAYNLLFFRLVSEYFEKNLVSMLQTTAKNTSGRLDNFVDAKVIALSHIANSKLTVDYLGGSGIEMREKIIEDHSVEQVLNYSLEIDTDLSFSWIISDVQNSMLSCGGSSEGLSFDVRSQPWYPQLISRVGMNNVWVSQSIMGSDGKPAISIVKAVSKNGNILGYVGLSIHLDKISDLVNNMQFGAGLYPLVVADDGTIIYESADEKYKKEFELPPSAIKNANVAASTRSEGVHKIKTDKGDRYITYIISDVKGWNYIFCFDTSEATTRFALFFTLTVALAAVFGVAIIVFIYLRLKRTFSELPRILEAAHNIRAGDYTKKCVITGADSYREIADTFNCLQNEIHVRDANIQNFIFTDPLTGIANRKKFYECMEEHIGADKENKSKFAVVYLDIDNFQWVNDTLGHSYGDEYLKQFSVKLSGIVELHGIISRFSADEFVFLVWNADGEDTVGMVLEKIRAVFQSPITVFSDELYVKFSIGVSFYPDDDTTPELLVRDADLAMSIAKEHRARHIVEYYSRSLYTNIANKAFIAKSLSPALANNEFYLNYQPIITTNSRNIHGFEVLLRWKNGEIGNIPPAEFIPVAEETGAIIPIGTWIFESACRFQKIISEEVKYPVNMSINVSPQQLLQEDYVKNIKMVVEITKIDPKNIQLEITEGVLIDLIETANNVLKELCDIGFTIALDDFGTGYSSLNYLKRFPIKCLKIDKSFIDEIYNSKRDYAITGSIIDLVHSLDITTVAEGVETKGQYDSLHAMKCDLIQGFLFSKPLTEYQAIDFVRKYDELHTPGVRYRKT